MMTPLWKAFLRTWAGQQRKRPVRRRDLLVQRLEDRCLLSAAPFQHVLILSVDGLHAADVADPALPADLTNIIDLQKSGVTYANASTTSPSDSFPGTLSYLTGAHPGTTGVFYDDSYSRTLLAPGSNSSAQPGTEVQYFENLDKNQNLISGGGNFDASSIDPNKLPIDPTTNMPVYPSQFLQTNTIFDVAHQAGLYTAFSDKHPAYQIANGNDPRAINDFYGPEINSFTALSDPSTGQTVNADTLLNRSAKTVTGLNVTPGFTVKSFATNPIGSSQPDSIAVDGVNVYVDYGNGVAKDGSDGKFSTIVQYDTAGKIVQSFSVLGHNDGLKVDPTTHKLWALQNEDANATLMIIDPKTGTISKFTLASVNHGGGFDDITFLDGKVYMTASNPSNSPNSDPAVVQITISGSTATLTPVLMGNATAINVATGLEETLNLQDPDSMTADNSGNLVFTSQSDNELVTIHHPGTAKQFITVLHVIDAANNPVSVDDTLFTKGSSGEVLVTDLNNGAIYQITLPPDSPNLVLTAARDIGKVGFLNTKTGVFTPVISGLGSPRGLAFLNAGPFADLSKYKLVDASTDPIAVDPTTHLSTDPNFQDTTTNFLLTEKYDDLKVQAILNEIKGLPSHTFFGSNHSQVPSLFGMNFQAVSVAEKDALGGIALLQNGQEGAPSTFLQAALEHSDASIGKIVQALKANGIWDSTMLVVTAKHGQNPRVGQGGLMHDNTLPDLLTNAKIGIAQVTQDDVSLIWLQNQKQTTDAVKVLTDFQHNGTIDVFYHGVAQTLPASQIIDKILSGRDLVNARLGNPATNSTSPDIVVTLKPGYIWVGNVNSQHKNAEHGGFSPDDTHVALIVAGGGLDSSVKSTTVTTPVETTQIAVTALKALGLDPKKLQGAVAEKTQELPGLFENKDDKKDNVLNKIDHFIVIYQENWSFDSLYGLFPGANGLQSAIDPSTHKLLVPQVDRAGNPISADGPTFNPLYSYDPATLNNPPPPLDNNSKVDSRFPTGLDTIDPYNLQKVGLSPADTTGDIVHRFYQEQSQIDGGKMDKFVTWSDNPGLVMSYFDATNLPEGQLAQQYVMADNFFHAAYGGSFLNHQFLVSAAAPVFPNAAAITPSSLPVLDAQGNLAVKVNPKTGTEQIVHDGKITPIGGAFDKNYAVNTIFSKNLVPDFKKPTDADLLPSLNDSDPTKPNYQPTIGDRLSDAEVSWKWYSGGWNLAMSDPKAASAANFQWHHQPLAYYDNFAPGTTGRADHLQDETNFFQDLQNNDLPAVSFIKPLGPDNEHPGYASLLQGQQHVADIVHAVQNSPEWAHTAIVITYDENGGRWDHVSAPTRDQWGDGSRVPAIVISPYAKQGYVDHEQHDTLSILSTIEQRFHLQPLNQADANASTLSNDFQEKAHDSIGKAYLQPDANTVGKNVLVVLGTEGNDRISITPSGNGKQILVNVMDQKTQQVIVNQAFDLSQISRIQVYGQGGKDNITVDDRVTLPAMIFAGDGNNVIHTGAGNTVVVGGRGHNVIEGGTGRDLLIGGAGRSEILAEEAQAILIAGTTNLGANPEALLAIETEWARQDENLAARAANIQSGVGLANQFKLNADTVHANGHHNELVGGSGMDWFFANLAKDDIDGTFGDDIITGIKKK